VSTARGTARQERKRVEGDESEGAGRTKGATATARRQVTLCGEHLNTYVPTDNCIPRGTAVSPCR